MAQEPGLTKEVFLRIAEISGLDTADPHMDELYSFVQSVLPGLKDLEALDLTGLEPFMPSPPCNCDRTSDGGDSK